MKCFSQLISAHIYIFISLGFNPDKVDDDEVSNEANNFQMVFSQKPQKTHLNEKTFQTFVKSIDFAIVYYYLPCI